MQKKFEYLRAPEQYAQYWYRESVETLPVAIKPKKHPYRTVFECDRDRVMYSSAFRRLAAKTQVFNSQVADKLRTRLTHTLEVAQIARTIACQLGLDEKLAEAIALGHDVGHTPFGHVGERTLNVFSKGNDKEQRTSQFEIPIRFYGFKHNLQSVRVLVEYSENVKFSNFMLFGVREHSKLYWERPEDVEFYNIYDKFCSYTIDEQCYLAWSFEAFIVKWADEVAQRHHDIEDAFVQRIMSAQDIVEKVQPLMNIIKDENINRKYERLRSEAERIERRDTASEQYSFAHTLSGFLVDVYVTVLIKEFSRVLKHFSNTNEIHTVDDLKKRYLEISVEYIREIMSLSDSKIYRIDKDLGHSLKYSILDSYEVQRMDGKGAYTIRKLVRAYLSNPQQLPNTYINRFIKCELCISLEGSWDKFLLDLNKSSGDKFSENVNIWKDYECREALRVIMCTDELMKAAYPALLRIILDYIAGMTDPYATAQQRELY